MTETKGPWAFQGDKYVGPGQMGDCPYWFTGNADDEWQDFFAAAWQFGQWASTTDVSGAGPSITMDVKPLMSGRADSLHNGHDVVGGVSKPVADGITLRLTDAVWAADVWGHFTELLAMLPWGHPDGELTIANQPRDEIVLHLWHD